MAKNDSLKRYLDAGVAFTQMTRERAESIVQDLVDTGEVRRKEAQKRIEQLIERSQKNTDELLGLIRREVAEQLKSLGLDDLATRTGIAERAAEKASPSASVKKSGATKKAGTSKQVGASKNAAAAKSGGAAKSGATKAGASKSAGAAKKVVKSAPAKQPTGAAKTAKSAAAKKSTTAKKA